MVSENYKEGFRSKELNKECSNDWNSKHYLNPYQSLLNHYPLEEDNFYPRKDDINNTPQVTERGEAKSTISNL